MRCSEAAKEQSAQSVLFDPSDTPKSYGQPFDSQFSELMAVRPLPLYVIEEQHNLASNHAMLMMNQHGAGREERAKSRGQLNMDRLGQPSWVRQANDALCTDCVHCPAARPDGVVGDGGGSGRPPPTHYCGHGATCRGAAARTGGTRPCRCVFCWPTLRLCAGSAACFRFGCGGTAQASNGLVVASTVARSIDFGTVFIVF